MPLPEDPAYKDWLWFPHGGGTDFKFTQCMQPLEPLRNQLTVLSGFSHPAGRIVHGHNNADQFLTGAATGVSASICHAVSKSGAVSNTKRRRCGGGMPAAFMKRRFEAIQAPAFPKPALRSGAWFKAAAKRPGAAPCRQPTTPGQVAVTHGPADPGKCTISINSPRPLKGQSSVRNKVPSSNTRAVQPNS